MIYVKEVLLQWLISFSIKSLQVELWNYNKKNEIMPNQELAEELHKPILENLKNEKKTHVLKTVYGVLIFLISS